MPLHLLPRLCPLCQDDTIIGHGRRLRQAHDDQHDRIWVRRGICRLCGKTFTVLPNWLAPSGHFSVPCRQQACERIAAGDTEASSAALQGSITLARCIHGASLGTAATTELVVLGQIPGQHFLQVPTIVAWDLPALCRILPFGARSP